MNRLRWLITLPLAIILIVFAVHNRTPADVDLFPFDLIVSWPLFVYVFAGALAGLLVGVLLGWKSAGPTRRLARERRARIRELEGAVARLEREREAGQEPVEPGLPVPARHD